MIYVCVRESDRVGVGHSGAYGRQHLSTSSARLAMQLHISAGCLSRDTENLEQSRCGEWKVAEKRENGEWRMETVSATRRALLLGAGKGINYVKINTQPPRDLFQFPTGFPPHPCLFYIMLRVKLPK